MDLAGLLRACFLTLSLLISPSHLCCSNDSRLTCSTPLWFSAGSFPHVVVGIASTAANAARRWRNTPGIVRIGFERRVVADARLIPCLGPVVGGSRRSRYGGTPGIDFAIL